MFTIIGLMLTGMCVGYLFRKRNTAWIQSVITLLIWLLLFILGWETGGNERVVNGLHTLGMEALLLTLAGTLGSVVAAKILWQATAHKASPASSAPSEEPSGVQADGDAPRHATWHALKGSLVIVSFFVAGALLAWLHCMPFDVAQTDIGFYALAALMTSVGISIGSDPQTLRNFRSLHPRLLWLPLCTIVGTLVGCALLSVVLQGRSLTDCLAVGSGMGYYSLSSIFITEYRGAELGTVALLANISREILTLLTAPLLVRLFGRLAPIAAGGATTMDTTLPVIVRASGRDLVVVSIFHGFLTDFSVPFLVTLFCSL